MVLDCRAMRKVRVRTPGAVAVARMQSLKPTTGRGSRKRLMRMANAVLTMVTPPVLDDDKHLRAWA